MVEKMKVCIAESVDGGYEDPTPPQFMGNTAVRHPFQGGQVQSSVCGFHLAVERVSDEGYAQRHGKTDGDDRCLSSSHFRDRTSVYVVFR